MVTPAQRQQVLRTFEAGLNQVPRTPQTLEHMRWHCRLRDPAGQTTIVAEYRLHADGTATPVWILPDVLWPSPPSTTPPLAAQEHPDDPCD